MQVWILFLFFILFLASVNVLGCDLKSGLNFVGTFLQPGTYMMRFSLAFLS